MSMDTRNTPSGVVAITPSDTTQLGLVGLQVGGAGTVTVVDSRGVTTAITCVAGQIIPCVIAQVKATGTTATNIVGFLA